jgi:hypothetical protein
MTTRLARFATLLGVIALVGAAAASSGTLGAPTGLHAFMLRADEPLTTTFHRTPSFAWDPYPGAVGYQFQLSMSSTFRENAIFYSTNTLTTPVAAPSLVLPWITGSPHSLYARTRGVMADGDLTPWSEMYGFDLLAPAPASALATDPGLLRWTPVEGATSYQVWLLDANKKERTHTNVLDEREFFTFHQSATWIGAVRWRVRAERSNEAGGPANGVPATSYGAWSPIYNSSNAAPTGAIQAIQPLHSISDVVSDGTGGALAHRLMPAFTWKGTQTLGGAAAELFRVYIFTDKTCLNRIWTGAVVGSPAYAPRLDGPLALPSDPAAIAAARGAYLADGGEPNGEMYDGTPVTAQEQAAPAAPTTAAPGDPGGQAVPPPAAGSSAPGVPVAPLTPGAPVDLWDTDTWPKGGYYWTVVGVTAMPASSSSSTVVAPGASQGSTLVPVADTTRFAVGQSITIGNAPDSDTTTISSMGNGLLVVSTPLNNGHAAGEPVASTASSGVLYRDMEMPQDVCTQQPSRVHRFGITSEPALTTAQEPFATGLSPKGRLVSSAGTGTFYGRPLVAWAPALSANTYQVQWSKKAYPFTPEGTIMTPSTSTILPLTVGTWYYRVRGFDYNLPTANQMLSWSDTEKLAVAPPVFRIAKIAKKKFKLVP